MYKRHGRSQCSRGLLIVRESIVTWSGPATSAVTLMIGSWQHTDHMRWGIYVCMGAFLGAAVSFVVRERAVAWSRFATGAVTIMTRHPRALRSHTSEVYAEYMIWERSGSRDVARGLRGHSLLGRASRRAL